MNAIECFGEQARGGGFAHPPAPGEQIGMGNAAGLDGVGESRGDSFLADQVGKLLRPITAGNDGVGGRRALEPRGGSKAS